MRVKVVKEFLYAADGFNAVMLRADEAPVDIRDDIVPGLEAEGFVKRSGDAPLKVAAKAEVKVEVVAEVKPATVVETTREIESEVLADRGWEPVEESSEITESVVEQIEIPADWKSMKWFALKSLAQSLSGSEIKNSEEARVVIESELKRRAAATS